jgi:hypothetical protein
MSFENGASFQLQQLEAILQTMSAALNLWP